MQLLCGELYGDVKVCINTLPLDKERDGVHPGQVQNFRCYVRQGLPLMAFGKKSDGSGEKG